jgi:DNA-binding transcriptional LysR family regulator
MEMHQVRYFLAVARTLNFTRAAEECNVAQPSLTRAIKLLEGELGGDLFRRERPRAMLTPLGERMHPLLKQCYDSAQSARALAAMINDGEIGALKLAVSNSIELGLILTHVNELRKNFSEIELKILRGTGPQVVEFLKSGDAELAVGTSIGIAWIAGSCSMSRSIWCSAVLIALVRRKRLRSTTSSLSVSCCAATAKNATTLRRCCVPRG